MDKPKDEMGKDLNFWALVCLVVMSMAIGALLVMAYFAVDAYGAQPDPCDPLPPNIVQLSMLSEAVHVHIEAGSTFRGMTRYEGEKWGRLPVIMLIPQQGGAYEMRQGVRFWESWPRGTPYAIMETLNGLQYPVPWWERDERVPATYEGIHGSVFGPYEAVGR